MMALNKIKIKRKLWEISSLYMEKSYWSHKNKISKIIVDFKLLLAIYFSFIYFYMNYANIAWYGGSEAWMFPYFFQYFLLSYFFTKSLLPLFLSISFLVFWGFPSYFLLNSFLLLFFFKVSFFFFLSVSFLFFVKSFLSLFFRSVHSSSFFDSFLGKIFKKVSFLFFQSFFPNFLEFPSDNWKVSSQLYGMKETTKIFNRVDVLERECKRGKVSNSVIANI